MLEIACMISLLSLPVKIPILAPSLCTQLYILQSYWTLSVPRKRHGLSPFPSQPMPIKFYCLEYFSHLFATVTHCLTPLLGQLITYLLGVILDVTFFTIPLHCTPRQDVLPTCYFKHLLFLSDLKLNHVYFNCLYSSLDGEPHEYRGPCLLAYQCTANAWHIEELTHICGNTILMLDKDLHVTNCVHLYLSHFILTVNLWCGYYSFPFFRCRNPEKMLVDMSKLTYLVSDRASTWTQVVGVQVQCYYHYITTNFVWL